MTIEVAISEFLQTYFFSGYTLFNTLVYGMILACFIFLIIKMFEYFKFSPIDLIFPMIPFILFGSSIRALVDNGIYPYNWFLITPGIYFIVAIAAISSLLFGILLQKKKNIDYRYTVFFIGSLLAILNLIKVPSLNSIAIFGVLTTWLILTVVILFFGKFWNLYKDNINLSVLSAHIFDASSTFIAVDFYGYWEQHVLPGSIYNLSGTAITMFPLKIIVISIVLYLIDKYIDDDTISETLKLAIFILGLAPGVRNFLSLAIGVS